MKSNLGRVALGALAVIAAAVLLILLQEDDGGDETNDGGAAKPARTGYGSGSGQAEKPSEPAFPTIAIRNGKPVGGIEEISVEEGERIRFEVTSNVVDEVHIHGYDVSGEVGPGAPARFDFPATIEGLFEGELHGSGEQILELRVNP